MTAETGVQTFGHLLRQYRLAAGLTQQELADRAGVSRRGIDDLERGARRAPYRDTVRRLVVALSLPEQDAARLEAAVARAHGRSSAPMADVANASPTGSAHARLPAPLTALVGREREVADLDALLRRDGVRLVTITGAGGMGKTRLSLQVAADVRDAFADGVWYVRLSRISDPELVLPTIAQAFDLKERGAMPLAEVLHKHLQCLRLLLVLDNFEQIVAGAPSVAALLEACAGVKALVTSRVALHVRGEHHYELHPLALPDPTHPPPPEQLAQYAAVALFIERAQAARAESVVSTATIPAAAEICARLDGLPLAIELAAARIRLLPPRALLKRMEHTLPMLRGGPRDLDERQKTMWNTLAWSYDLLSPAEQRLFRRLAVFAGGCTLAMAEAICVAPEGIEPLGIDVLDGLESLVDQHLVQPHEEGGEARFGMLHVIREFAAEQLEASGEAEPLRRTHAEFFERQAAGWRTYIAAQEGAAREPANQAKHTWIEAERANIRAVLGWAKEHGEQELGLSVARTLMTFWMRRGLFAEGRSWLEGLLALPPPSGAEGDAATNAEQRARLRELQASAYYFAGTLAGEQRGTENLAGAAALLEESVRRFRDLGDLSALSEVLLNLAAVLADLGEVSRAEALAEECWRVSQQFGLCGAIELAALGQFACEAGNLERARALSLKALRLTEHAAKPWERPIHAYWTLVRVALRRGDVAEARKRVRDALRWLGERDKHVGRLVPTLELLSMVDALAGRYARVAHLQGALEAPIERTGADIPPSWKYEFEAALARSQAALGEEAWQAAYTAGRAHSLEEAAAEALSEQP